MSKHTSKIFFLVTFTLMLAGIFLSGCNTSKTESVKPSGNAPAPTTSAQTPANSSESTSAPADAQTVKLTLYFPNNDASALIPTVRTVQVTDQEVIKAMFNELAKPPAGVENPLPKGTTLLGASVKDGVATINLSPEFKKNFGGGSAAEQMTIFSIVNTLTTLPDVHSVQFLLDGKKTDAILAELDTSVPVKPNPSLNKTN